MTSIFELYNHYKYGEQKRRGRLSVQEEVSVIGFTPDPVDTTKVWGCDLDPYSGVADFNVAKQNNMKFCIIKGIDGTMKSKYADQNVAGAEAVGMPYGIYGWLYPSANISTSSQAKAWYNYTHPIDPPLGVYCDLEWTTWNGRPSNPTYKDLYGINEVYKQLAGINLGVYTAPSYWNQYGSSDPYWNTMIEWLAAYGYIPKSVFGIYTFLQFSPKISGLLVGIPPSQSSAIDGDYYEGSYDQFLTQFNLNGNVPPVVPPVNNPTITHNINIFSDGSIK